jgi:hypothetical protein
MSAAHDSASAGQALDPPTLLLKFLLLSALVRRPDASAADAAVLAALLERLNEETGLAWPSLQRLADDTGRNRVTVVRSLRHLCELGFVQVAEKGTKTTTTRYRPQFDKAVRMPLKGSSARATRCADATRCVDATGVVAWTHHEPTTHNPQGYVEGENAASPRAPGGAAGPRAPFDVELPACIDPAAWRHLCGLWRPKLDAAHLIRQAEAFALEGATRNEIAESLRRLAIETTWAQLPKPSSMGKPKRAREPRKASASSAAETGFDQKDYSVGVGHV